MFKTKPIYNLKEKAIKDWNKSYQWERWIIYICWITFAFMILTAIVRADSRTQQELATNLLKEAVVEDYSKSLPDYPMEFGDVLKADSILLKGNYSQDQKDAITLAWKISHDKEFLYMLALENGHFSPDRLGDGGKSKGYCQIHSDYHSAITNHPEFNNPSWQIQKCYDLWKGGTRFYGYDRMKNPHTRKLIESLFQFYG